MRIAFRADASIQIGTGHVMRSLTLADELTRQGHECLFVCRAHPGHLGDLILSKDYDLRLLPAATDNQNCLANRSVEDYSRWLGVPWQDDANQTLEVISSLAPDWLIVDHYALDARWERAVAGAVGKIMVIDDLANRPHECLILLDQNLGRVASDYDGLLPVDCQRLIGPLYALLRPEFAELREQSLKRRDHTELKRILISLGGVDRTNVTGLILKALAKSSLSASTELDIIMGGSAPYLDEVREQASLLPFNTTVSVNVQDMAERMCLADLSIGAAGSTSWERCCMGLPSITVIIADNQRSIAEVLAKYKAGLLVNTSQIAEELAGLIQMYADSKAEYLLVTRNAAQICDGGGVNRVVSALTGEIA